jgi:hypothetical protein
MAMQTWPNQAPAERDTCFNTDWPACATQIHMHKHLLTLQRWFSHSSGDYQSTRPAKAYAQQVSARKDD